MVCMAVVVSMVCGPKVKVVGDTATTGCDPVPVKDTLGFAAALD
jgi:hypothetical protein